MKAAPMTQKPSFPLMKQGDVQNIYHLQMPRWLFTDTKYMELALETKVAYTFLLNRFQLSRLNGWVNEDGAVFIIYTRRSLAEEMQVSYRKIIEAMKELTAAGLIWEKRCGRGDANQIYLALIEHPDPQNSSAPFVPPEHEAAGGEPEAGPENDNHQSNEEEAEEKKQQKRDRWRNMEKAVAAVIIAVFLVGNGYTTYREIRMTIYRKEACINRANIALDFENRTNEELAAAFEYHTSSADAGDLVRNALTILKEHKWNVFYR